MDKVTKTDDEWRDKLTPEEYEVTRCSGTERAFTGLYWDTKTPGLYRCKCCGTALFDSNTKYDSGSGWPSFYKETAQGHVGTKTDASLGVERTEIHCARCGAHLGHVFPDGPKPTGLRHCVNSLSLKFAPRGSDEAEAKSE
jgi:peptide-methionine (R)-S-oxide reductase